jgi:tetratricopeptide (TPR) repeat protein
MSNSTGYGQSFAKKLFDQGKYEEALAEADKAIALDGDDPEPVFDRAQVLFALERWDDGIGDVRRALELDQSAQVLDDFVVDDVLFSSILAWAKKVGDKDRETGVKILGRYAEVLPRGAHMADVTEWTRRLRGELVTTSWTKQR